MSIFNARHIPELFKIRYILFICLNFKAVLIKSSGDMTSAKQDP